MRLISPALETHDYRQSMLRHFGTSPIANLIRVTASTPISQFSSIPQRRTNFTPAATVSAKQKLQNQCKEPPAKNDLQRPKQAWAGPAKQDHRSCTDF